MGERVSMSEDSGKTEKYAFWALVSSQTKNKPQTDESFSGHCHRYRCSEYLKWFMSKPVFFLIPFWSFFFLNFED